ncbi:MAG: RNA methyltransferase [Lachnospiraceae bacterium]|nr:RNA methyltransferase [Lachnospiraceae bacterium]
MITSTANQQIKTIIKLQKSSSFRRKQGLFIVEGIRMFREIPKKQLEKCYVTEAFLKAHEELFAGISYELVSETVFRDISDTMTPQGGLALVKQLSYTFSELVETENTPALLLLENVQDPGNLGTILRMAEGAGMTGVLLSKDTVDIYNSKVIRSTMGSIFRVPFLYVEDVMETAEQLTKHGIVTCAAHLGGTSFYEVDFQKPCCIFIGNEGNGLTEELTEKAQKKLVIPMMGQVESLNAATAATVFSYEILRQRMSKQR